MWVLQLIFDTFCILLCFDWFHPSILGLICSEGGLWKDQRRFVANWLRSIGATKIGPQRKNMESLILKHANELVNVRN